MGNQEMVEVRGMDLGDRVPLAIGGGLYVTANRSNWGSSQTSIGSMKGPVENSQRRTAPTP